MLKITKLVIPFRAWSKNRLLVFAALMAVFAALLQSMGAFSGLGFLISPLATAPIFLITFMSKKFGSLAYLVTIFMLLVIRPNELFVFPFTTGLLGISLGITLSYLRHFFVLAFTNGLALTIGICFILYILKFPVLGPSLAQTFDVFVVGVVCIFAVIYSAIWLFLCRFFLQKLSRFN